MRAKVEGDLAQLEERRKKIDEQRDEVLREIKDRRRIISDLDALMQQGKNGRAYTGGIATSMGVTHAVNAVIHKANGAYVKPTDIRKRLVDSGFLDSPSLMPQIHSALRRIKKRGEAEGGSKRGYKRTSGANKK